MLYIGWDLFKISQFIGILLFLGIVGILSICASIPHFCNVILGRDRYGTDKSGGY